VASPSIFRDGPQAVSAGLVFCASFGLGGCGSLRYLWQAGEGQLALIHHARPIYDVIRDEKTPPKIRELLGQVGEIKRFGEKNGLKATSNYQDYVKLERPAAVWVVSACDPLKFQPKEWTFPLVGSFPYLGWFDSKNAQDYSETLRNEGWDVDLRGAAAYSTLGWFHDSVLSSMISGGKEALGDLVNVVLHESVHATVYVTGQSFFNESIASFIADRLTLEYFDRLAPDKIAEKQSYLEGEQRAKKIHQALFDGYKELNQLYSSSDSESEKLRKKVEILSRLQVELQFKRKINNATLIQYKTYHTGTEDFESLYQACGKNWAKLLSALRSLKSSSFPKSQLDQLEVPIREAASYCRR
jgi:predicted aminopeptidase